MLCCDDQPQDVLVAVRRCGHVLCKDCLRNHARARIESNPGGTVREGHTPPVCMAGATNPYHIVEVRALDACIRRRRESYDTPGHPLKCVVVPACLSPVR